MCVGVPPLCEEKRCEAQPEMCEIVVFFSLKKVQSTQTPQTAVICSHFLMFADVDISQKVTEVKL